jgi:hypothetical protein
MVRGGVHGDLGGATYGGRFVESRAELDTALRLTHVLTYFAARRFNRNEISTRFPQIAGFYPRLSLFFLRAALGRVLYGLAALVVPLSTQAHERGTKRGRTTSTSGFVG